MNTDINVPINVVLGSTKVTLEKLMAIGKGTVMELDRLAGEPVDIYAGDRLIPENMIAKGEVVVIDENFGIRVTEVVPVINIKEQLSLGE